MWAATKAVRLLVELF